MPEEKLSDKKVSTNQVKIIAPVRHSYRRAIRVVIISFIITIIAVLVAGFFFPQIFAILFQIFWITLLCFVIFFFLVGLLIIIGFKEQAKQIIDMFMEGSLQLFDIIEIIRRFLDSLVTILKNLIYGLVPVVAIILAIWVYFLLMILYKWVGATYDVTWFTIGLTITLVAVVGFLNRPQQEKTILPENLWWNDLKKHFASIFGDALEVVIFIFFLTMDSTKLFFLPQNLQIELHAKIGDYNFMEHSAVLDTLAYVTISMIMISVLVEVLRNVVRIIILGVDYYQSVKNKLEEEGKDFHMTALIKWALRRGYRDSIDDLIKMFVFMTVLIFVFIFFPRLKLLAMALTSVVNFSLDIFIPARLRHKKGDDLVNRIVVWAFKL